MPSSARAAAAVLVGFVALIAIGTLVLATPAASRTGTWTRLQDALFTSVSAASDTGLVVVDTADHWSWLGQATIAAQMALGGLGIMASATLAVMMGRRTKLEDRATVTDAFGGTLGSARSIVRGTIAFAVGVQLVGALLFLPALAVAGRGGGPFDLAWSSIFLAISAFNNAGFDLAHGGGGFGIYAGQPAILALTAALVVVGGLGFAIATDIARRRRWRSFALETKLVLLTTVILILAGAVGLAAYEWANPRTMGLMSPVDKVTNALFMSISPRSAGFSSVDLAGMQPETDGIIGLLMFVGTASGSTGGGIKVNTVAVLVIVAVASATRGASPGAFGRRLTYETITRAVTVVAVSFAAVFLGGLAVLTLSGAFAGAALFETISAFGTSGLSITGTATYDDATRLVLAACMFLGRLGPLALVILLFGRTGGHEQVRRPEAAVRVG
jgi:trk system potassium uptake protein TrkH